MHDLATLLARLRARGAKLRKPPSASLLRKVADDLGAELPPELLELYRRHDGEDRASWRSFRARNGPKGKGSLAARFLPLAEVLQLREVFADPNDPVGGLFAQLGLGLFWEDEGSNHAGVFVSGPLAGMVAIHIHDDVDPSPRFASVESFLRALAGGAKGIELRELEGDFPLGPSSSAALVERARVASEALAHVVAGAQGDLRRAHKRQLATLRGPR